MADTIPRPAVGRLTFDAEGREGGRYHSRCLHVPSSASGVTLGRGYDMKLREKTQVRDDLMTAGVKPVKAALISQAAGLKGERAEEFIEENQLESFEIKPKAQLRLFEIEYQRQAADTRRLATKADVTKAYGRTDWEALNPAIREVLVDLRFRGDYTPACRRFLQKHVVKNDLKGFAQALGNERNWPNVPPDRFKRRRKFCKQKLAA